MNLSIFGLGYVGAVSLACLARDGHQVIGVDIDRAKLTLIIDGKTPVVEEGMIELMAQVVSSGRVRATTDVRKAIVDSEMSLVCVGTPSAPNGSQNQAAVLSLMKDLGQAIKEKNGTHVFVLRSTLVPGTVEDVLIPVLERESGKREGIDFHVCFQPEFLREGSSIRDYDSPPFTIVGAASEAAVEPLRKLFGHLPCKFLVTSIRAAEMVKYCCNNFHALKITFANETARLCDALGVDAFEVMDLVCEDTQLNISKAYLRPGFAFGGSCLPKDLRATTYLSKTRDVDLPMIAGILQSNQAHLDLAIEKVLAHGCRRVGMIGLSFKTGTDDLRESPLVVLAERLIGKGITLSIYDPYVNLSRLLGANKRFIEQSIPHIGSLMRDSVEPVIQDSELIVLGISDRPAVEALRSNVRPDQVVLDLIGMRDRQGLGGRYIGLCWQ
jgi:GDP-mannose 6-dehydrogenase